MISKQDVAQQLVRYLNHSITLPQLVEWSETAIQHGDVEQGSSKTIMQALGRLGVADVKEFGILWEDCETIMRSLGYEIKVNAILAA